VNEVVAYAAKLAIRVVPEFDNPGHVRAIGLDSSFNDIIRCFNKDWPNSVPNAYKINGGPPTGVLDPSEDKTYELLTGILTDLNALFPDSMIHLGGDEVFTSCFDENPNIKTFMAEMKIATYSDLITHHLMKTRDILTSINDQKQALYWSNEDTFYMKYSDNDILMYWGHSENIATLKKTYPFNEFVFSPSDYYYLDCGYGNKYGGNSWCDPFKTWWTIYQFEPSTYLDDGTVIGGEVPAWSELFGDANIHSRIWPRAAAMADKLWGQNVPTDLVAIVDR
jgi:hexosaminidase